MDKVLSCPAKWQQWEGYSKGRDLLPLVLHPSNPNRSAQENPHCPGEAVDNGMTQALMTDLPKSLSC